MSALPIESGSYHDREPSGFELGWEHARHALTPPLERLGNAGAIRQGWEAGRARFGTRARPAGESTRIWLHLRVQAWQHTRSFETMSVTPHYLGQLAASHCPVTRQPLTGSAALPAAGVPTDAVIARLCNDAGYAAGHLATLSAVADTARADLSWHTALQQAPRIEAAGGGRIDGLSGDAWRRLGVLLSFVTPLPHAQAARLPLLVLPPNRVHLRNPIQALQVFATRLLARSGWSSRLHSLMALLPNDTQREDFQRFFVALLARVIEAGQPTDTLRRRWALEDAWRGTEVQQLWWQFALQLDADQAERLMARAAERGLADQHVVMHSDEQTTAGWSLDTGGYLTAMPLPLRPTALRRRTSATAAPAAAAYQLVLPWSQPTAGA